MGNNSGKLKIAHEATLQSEHNRNAETQRTQQTQIQHNTRVHEANEQTKQETARQETERTRLQTQQELEIKQAEIQREKEQDQLQNETQLRQAQIQRDVDIRKAEEEARARIEAEKEVTERDKIQCETQLRHAEIQRDVDIRKAEEETKAKIEAEKEATEREKIQRDREVCITVEHTKQEEAKVEQKRIDADAALKTAEIELRKAEVIRDTEREKTRQIELGGNREEYLEHLEDRIAAALARIAEQQNVIRNNNQRQGRTERAEYGAQNSVRNY